MCVCVSSQAKPWDRCGSITLRGAEDHWHHNRHTYWGLSVCHVPFWALLTLRSSQQSSETMRQGVFIPALIGQMKKRRGEVNCSRSHSELEREEPGAIPSILPRVPGLTATSPTPMAWAWRLSSLLISCTRLVAHCPFMALVIACICVCLRLLEKGLPYHPCPPAQGAFSTCLAPGRHEINTCWILSPLSPEGGYLPHASLVVLTRVILTATLWDRHYPWTHFTNKDAPRWSQLLKVTWLQVGGGATGVKCEWTRDLGMTNDS